MKSPRVLIAGVGNIFLGDDGFGVEVAQRLARRDLPDGVRVVDFGIRGLDLTYALLDVETVILVDATPRDGPAGALYVLEPDVGTPREPDAVDPLVATHGMDPVKVLRLAAALGSRVERLLLVGCEPAAVGSEEELALGLSEPVRAAVDEAVLLIESLVARILRGECAGALNQREAEAGEEA
jgi:hydrogenase maturation protease